MATTVLALGLKSAVVDEVRERVALPDVDIRGGTNLTDLRATLAATPVDHVIMGAGLDLEDRLRLVRAVFEASDRTTVHMKDFASGPEGFASFVRAVLTGLHGTPS
ncbi:hypothetical protein ACFXPR_08465 [Nocardia tengchongensis]|uniref:hypothetical protein n=1 Tax=Nocardia tengchongensis TaxID=2055889 RepID=UPI00367BFAEE